MWPLIRLVGAGEDGSLGLVELECRYLVGGDIGQAACLGEA